MKVHVLYFYRHHCFVEAIPVPFNMLQSAPIWFRKALDDTSDEFQDTHHSKRCIPTKGRDGLKRSIPEGFPYFHVEFGLGDLGGFVHIIYNEDTFDPNLGRNVASTLLEYDIGDGKVGNRDRVFNTKRLKEKLKRFDWALAQESAFVG